MPVIPACLLEPVWVQCPAVLPEHPAISPARPLGCHRPRIPDRVVFEHGVAALVHGSGYERIADRACSDRPIRRRVREWADAGLAEGLHTLALRTYDRMLGLGLAELPADGCSTTALGPTLAGREKVTGGAETGTVHLDRGYDGRPTRALLADPGFAGAIARKGVPAPIQAGGRWVVERAHAWMNGYGKRRRCPEKRRAAVDFHLLLAASLVVVRPLIQRGPPPAASSSAYCRSL